jgi:hypothetical protein
VCEGKKIGDTGILAAPRARKAGTGLPAKRAG